MHKSSYRCELLFRASNCRWGFEDFGGLGRTTAQPNSECMRAYEERAFN
jgi:hypothetical protein